MPDEAHVCAIAQKIVARLTQPFLMAGQSLQVSASVGVSLYPQDGQDPQALVREADAAMYRAKERGRNGYALTRDSA